MPRRFTLVFLGLAGAAAVALAAYFVVIRDDGGGTSLYASEMTVEALYAAIDQRIAANDGTLHLRSTMVSNGIYHTEGLTETWITPAGPRVRDKFTFDLAGHGGTTETLTTPEERFRVDSNNRLDPGGHVTSSEFWRCHGATIAAAAILPCPGLDGDWEQRVEEGTYKGSKVVALVEQGTSGGETRTEVTMRTYLDAATLMPIRRESFGVYLLQVPAPFTTSEDFELVSYDAQLPPDFFEPGAIGYIAPDPLEGLRAVADLQAYWLGQRLTLPSGEVLILQGSMAAPGRGQPYRLSLQYATEASPHQPPFLTVMVFHRDMWERSPAIPAQAVTFGDVVVFVNAGTIPGQRSLLEGSNLEFVFSQLRLFEP